MEERLGNINRAVEHADSRIAELTTPGKGHQRKANAPDTLALSFSDHRDEWQQFWRAAYAAERCGGVGVVSVGSREAENDLDPAS